VSDCVIAVEVMVGRYRRLVGLGIDISFTKAATMSGLSGSWESYFGRSLIRGVLK